MPNYGHIDPYQQHLQQKALRQAGQPPVIVQQAPQQPQQVYQPDLTGGFGQQQQSTAMSEADAAAIGALIAAVVIIVFKILTALIKYTYLGCRWTVREIQRRQRLRAEAHAHTASQPGATDADSRMQDTAWPSSPRADSQQTWGLIDQVWRKDKL
jgi:hypothetical protein